MHFWRCCWMRLGPFCLYSGLSPSQLCTGQRPKFCSQFGASSFYQSQTTPKPWELPMAVCSWGQSLKLNHQLANSVQSCKQGSLRNQNKLLWRLETDAICIVATPVNSFQTQQLGYWDWLRDHNGFPIIIFSCITSLKKKKWYETSLWKVSGCLQTLNNIKEISDMNSWVI